MGKNGSRALVLALLAVVVTPASAATKVKLTGKVTEKGLAFKAVPVTATNTKTKVVKRTLTKTSGDFELDLDDEGDYTVACNDPKEKGHDGDLTSSSRTLHATHSAEKEDFALAAAPVTLHGRVSEAGEKNGLHAVIGVTVKGPGSFKESVDTNAQGAWSAKLPEAGEYTIVVNDAAGKHDADFQPRTDKVSVHWNSPVHETELALAVLEVSVKVTSGGKPLSGIEVLVSGATPAKGTTTNGVFATKVPALTKCTISANPQDAKHDAGEDAKTETFTFDAAHREASIALDAERYMAKVAAKLAKSQLRPGETTEVLLTLTNTGGIGWGHTDVVAHLTDGKFGLVTKLPAPPLVKDVKLCTVPPCAPHAAPVKASFQVTAPLEAKGTHSVSFRLVHLKAGGEELFARDDDTKTVTFSVVDPGDVGIDESGKLHLPILQAFERLGAEVGTPFDPDTNAPGHTTKVRREGSAWVQHFHGGSGGEGALIYRDNETEAHWVHGKLYSYYVVLGGPAGHLGAPVGPESESKEQPQTSVTFENGKIGHTGERFHFTLTRGQAAVGAPERFAINASLRGHDDRLLPALGDMLEKELGAPACRIELAHQAWDGPSDAAEKFNGRSYFEYYDAMIDGLQIRGCGVYGLLNYELMVAKDGQGKIDSVCLEKPEDARTPEWIRQFAQACAVAVKHFRDRVTVFEILNEPNNLSRVDPKWCAEVVTQVYDELRKDPGNAHVKIVSPAFISAGDSPSNDWAADYLKKLVVEPAMTAFASKHPAHPLPFDAVAYHPYVFTGPGTRSEAEFKQAFTNLFNNVHTILRASGPVEIWCSEFGFDTNIANGESDQVVKMKNAYAALGALTNTANFEVKLAALYALHDTHEVDKNTGQLKHFGLIREEGDELGTHDQHGHARDYRKPSFAEFKLCK